MKIYSKLALALMFSPMCAVASGLDVCGIKENAPIWAAFRTPGFIVEPELITKNFPLPGSKIFNAAAFGYDRIMLQEIKFNHQPLEEARALATAATMGRLTTTAALIGAGVSPNAEIENRLTPLYAAAQSGCSEEINYLVSVGANVNFHADVPESILELSISMRHYDTAKVIVALGYYASDDEKADIKKMLTKEGVIYVYKALFDK